MRRCLNCGVEIHGHPNKKFCTNKGKDNCKDLYYNSGKSQSEPDVYLDEFMDDADDNFEASLNEDL